MNELKADQLALAQRALNASEARFFNLIEKNADGIVVVSLDGIIRYMNPAAEALFECESRDCIGTLFGIPVAPNEKTELDIPRGDACGIVAEMRVSEIEWEGETAFLASLRDITDRKRAEDALREADRRKDEFLAMLAHELRNPLAAVSYAFTLLSQDDRDELSDAYSLADEQLRNLARLIDDLLDVARITRGKIELRKSKVELGRIVNRVVKTAAYKAGSRREELTIAQAKEPLFVEGDAVRLEQVISNLVDNALKYTPEGCGIAVSVSREGDDAVIRIRDHGVGMSAETLSRVFELFAQADSSLDRSRGGLGIGLTLVRRLVEMHDGRVEASSEGLGLGSEFTVRLPRHAPPATDDEPSLGPDGAEASSQRRRFRVLLVEDQRPLATMFAKLLERKGHEVRIVHDGPSALGEADAFDPELILLDIGLPGMDGYEVARRLRSRPAYATRPIVALSGYGQDEAIARSREVGFNRHLVKPISLAALDELFWEVEQIWTDGAPADKVDSSSDSGTSGQATRATPK